MGPRELQLSRDFAIQVVRECVGYLHSLADERAFSLKRQRLWFADIYEQWATTPRPELGGRTPGDIIREEREELGLPEERWPDAPYQMEFYTDLPEVAEADEESLQLTEEDLALLDGAGALNTGEMLEELPPLSAAEQARWERFRDRHLRGWLDSLLPPSEAE